jgi:hypothetical protein
MKISLKLREMFALAKLAEVQEIIGYKAALTKLYYEMINNEKFNKLIDIFEKINLNNTNIKEKYIKENQELIIKQKDIDKLTEEEKNQLTEINKNFSIEIRESNNELVKEITEMIDSNENVGEFEFNPLLISAIKNIIESTDKKINETKLDKLIIENLIEVYVKLPLV